MASFLAVFIVTHAYYMRSAPPPPPLGALLGSAAAVNANKIQASKLLILLQQEPWRGVRL